jgi:ATP-dependent helicase/nuclease subunit B
VPVERLFLGWDAPLVDTVCGHLAPAPSVGPVDLADTLILVPTRQAGRRLRESLARRCSAAGQALLSVRAVPPAILFAPVPGPLRVASGVCVKSAWAEVLLELDVDARRAFCAGDVADMAWALHTGEMLQRLREQLCEGGYLVRDVVEHLDEEIQEQERWRAMAGMEQDYLDRLARGGYEDPCAARLRSAAAPRLPESVTRVVVAGVPDLARLAVRALEVVSRTCRVEILVHAPAGQAEAFDDWGMPVETHWESVPIDIPTPAQNVFVAATPLDQARRVVQLVATEQERFGPADIGVAVPDVEVAPCVAELLSAHGVETFDPAEHAVSEHPLAAVLALYAELVTEGAYATVSRFLRNADVLAHLAREERLSPAALLAQLDRFQNRYLPATLTDMVATLGRVDPERFAVLRKAIGVVDAWRHAFARQARAQDAVREFLGTLYRGRTISTRSNEDAVFRAVAEKVDAVLHEFDGLETQAVIAPRDALRLLLQRLAEETYQPQRPDGVLELEGWLELPWNDAPLVIVTGMNEGMVPDGRIGDAFLPDALRVKLGLRHDRRRLARDAFMLHTLIRARADRGRVCLLVGKTTTNGDPLKPSRLLFRCADSELVKRARLLFGPVTQSRPDCPRSVAFKLQPVIPGEPAACEPVPRELSVTTFRAYLACPFRFYLGRVLGMEPVADDKQGLDALDFGTLLHAVLQEMVEDNMWRCDDAAALAGYLQERVTRRMEDRYGAELSLPLCVALEAARQRLALVAAVQVELVRAGWEVECSEQRLEMNLAGFRIRGTLDRVDRHRETGRRRIIDYKTSDTPVTPAKAHLAAAGAEVRAYALLEDEGRPRRWIDLQLPLYRLLLATTTGEDSVPELAYFNIPKAATLTAVECWSDFSEARMASARQCAEGVLADIAAGIFWPAARRLRYDDFERLLLSDPEATVDPAALAAMGRGA